MARPDRALAVDAGLTGVLGVVFLASTAGASDARPLDGLGWALLAANVLLLLALRRAPLLVVACLSVAYPGLGRARVPDPPAAVAPHPGRHGRGAAGLLRHVLHLRRRPARCHPARGVARAADALPMAYAVDVLQRGWWTGEWDATGLAVQMAVLVAATAVALWRLRDA
jgi:hypothetical protein